MEHSFIDQYSDLQGIVQTIDPRAKIVTFFAFILFIVFTTPESFYKFALYGIIILVLIILSRIPILFFIKRSLVVIPFVFMIGLFIPFIKEGQVAGAYSFGTLNLTVTRNGLLIFWNVFIKSCLSILCLILLTSSTKFSHLLRAFEDLKMPKLFLMILSFMYRYIFVTMDELMRMKQAKDSRTINPTKAFNFKALANMIGNLFIRAYERGERIYLAMCARGFDGDIKTLKRFRLTVRDIMFFTLLFAALCLIRCWRGI